MVAQFVRAINPALGMPFFWLFWRLLPTPSAWLTAVVLLCCGCGLGSSSIRRCGLWEAQASKSATHLLDESSRQAAVGLVHSDDQRCVDDFFVATRFGWQAALAASEEQIPLELRERASVQYHANLRRLLYSAQKFGRLDPRSGLQLGQGDDKAVVPIVHCGFPWRADDFQRISPPPQDLPELLRCRYTLPGCGVPLVVQRCRNPQDPAEIRFFAPQSFFAATAILRFSAEVNGQSLTDSRGSPVLEFHNPLRLAKVSLPEGSLPLAGDLTAPLATTLQTSPRTYLSGFVQPGSQDDPSKLGFLEPYQKGKPPVVLIHGLFSDPQSWADLVNDLRAIPGFCDRFQIWYFRYPTGQGFLRSAADLRQDLQAAIQTFDPERTDPALREMVLVGHSMGGLIAKLQVTHSDDTIWRRLANRPFDEIQADEETRTRLAMACFFQPAPHVRRVIFIATPHGGSNEASGFVGNVATLLVREPPQEAQAHQRLLEQNPGVFADVVQRRLPTSIDLLKPQSPLLDALREMRIGKGVELHTIIGVTFHPSLHGPSDGVVPVASAKHPGSLSETWIQSPHSKVHRAAGSTKEVARILAEHCFNE